MMYEIMKVIESKDEKNYYFKLENINNHSANYFNYYIINSTSTVNYK